MAINPFQLVQLQQMFETFRNNHPKFLLFFQAAVQNTLTEGSVIEITAKSPDGKEYCTNLKLTSSDVEMLQMLKRMREQK